MKKRPREIKVPPEQVRFLREEVFSPLSLDEIGDLLGVGRSTLRGWMKDGISSDAPNLDRYFKLEAYVQQYGARPLMEGKILPLVPGWRKSIRCHVLEERGNRFVQCRNVKVLGMSFCQSHLKDIREKGGMYMTIDGDVTGFRGRRGFRGAEHSFPKMPQRCVGLSYAGTRCRFVGRLTDGLCARHHRELSLLGRLVVLTDGLTETIYAEESG